MSADRQVVVVLLTGGPGDVAARDAAADLAAKAARRGLASPRIEVPAGAPAVTEPALVALGPASRLYVVGETSRDRRRVGGLAAADLARRLAAAGLAAVGRVSLVADHAALPSGVDHADPADAAGLPAGVDRSFAASLHRELAAVGVRTDVAARTGAVRVLGAEAGADRGRKVTRRTPGEPWVHAEPEAKLVWRWDGARQVVGFAERR